MNKSIVSIAVTAALITTAPLHAEEDNGIQKADEIIVITGKRPDQTLNEVAGSIAVMSAQEIERHLVTDMSQLFKYDPSIKVTGRSGSALNFVIRGMGGDRVLMIKDGMRMNEGYGANGMNDIVGRGFIEMDTLKHVEVAKGAASSLYGADALGGIVVFTTKDPSDYLTSNDFYASVKAGYESESSEKNIGTTVAFSTGYFGHIINLSHRVSHEDENYHDTKIPLDLDSTSIFYKGVLDISDKQQLKFSADLWQQDGESNVANTLAGPFRGLAQFGYKITKETNTGKQKNNSFKFSYHDQVARDWSDQFNIALYSNKTSQNDVEFVNLDINAPMFHVVGIRDMWSFYEYKQTTVGFISNAVKTMGDHSLGFGLDIERTMSTRPVHQYRIQNGDVIKDIIEDKFPENEVLRAGLFINDNIELSEQATLLAGLRWDSFTMDPQEGTKSGGYQYKKISEQQLSPNLGLVYDFTKELTVYAQYAKGFKVPPYDLAYIDHDNSRYGYKIVPTDNLDPESSDSFEIGLRINTDNFAFSSAIYHNVYDDFITINLIEEKDTNNDGVKNLKIYQYANLDKVIIDGAEVNLTYFINDQMEVFANTSYQDGQDDKTDRYIRDISPLSGTVGFSVNQDNWGGDVLLRWAKSMNKINEGEIGSTGYGVVDMTAYIDIAKHTKINLGVFNLLNKEYTDYSNVAGSHKTDDSVKNAAYRLETGRQFSVNVKYIF